MTTPDIVTTVLDAAQLEPVHELSSTSSMDCLASPDQL
ncbi:hypothetical protein QFZ33_002305 [Arthrobacter globiformis]|nr:hypothetical protein [Arthrobacter globiformis]